MAEEERLKTVKMRVAYILEAVPEARSNDNLLLSTYWMLFDNITDVSYVPRATKAETIMRTRRALMNVDGLGDFIKNFSKEDNK